MLGTVPSSRARVRALQVAIADDDPTFRQALADVLDADVRFEVVGVVASGGAVLDLVDTRGADVVLLDVRMPGGGAAGALALRRAAGPDGTPPAVVALSAQSGAAVVTAMLRAGVVGYLVKGRVGSDLPDVLVRCAAGEVVLAVGTAAEALHHVVDD
jgi:DNA-binding NarL/FixJ family response regulator